VSGGGGGGGVFLTGINVRRMFFDLRRGATAGRSGFFAFAVLTTGREARLVVTAARAFGLSFGDTILVAFFARAFPAGERLVAGRRRVDFFPASTRLRDCDALGGREVDREDDLLVVVLMD